MELKCRAIAMVLFVLASTPALAQDNMKPLPSIPDPLSSASYTIPDTDVDLRLVAPPQSAPGTRMVLAPNADSGAFGVTLQIPAEVLDDPLDQGP